MNNYKRLLLALVFSSFSFSSCTPPSAKTQIAPTSAKEMPAAATIEPTLTLALPPTPTITPTPQPFSTPNNYGPEQEDFPEGINPLTGLAVSNPLLLEQPALLISIPHFPVSARPQSGLSFAPWVFEFLVGEGTTRFLAVFHGAQPYEEMPIVGDCEVRTEAFVHNGEFLGNFVWLDEDGDGTQSPGEKGVGGICIRLYDDKGEIIQETSTDSNGYYGFNVEMGKSYQVEFMRPENIDFSLANIGAENADSDADPANGMTAFVTAEKETLFVDAGFTLRSKVFPDTLGGQIGPVRSGRLIHIHIQNFFRSSCLIFSGATKEIIDQLPFCAQVHNTESGAGSMLEVKRFVAISEKNAKTRIGNFNYASNLFSETPPNGGLPADQVNFFASSVNQTKWVYEPLTKNWARYVDNASEELVFTRDTDKLTGRELSFENIIVLFVEHEVIIPRVADMHMEMGLLEKGYLFRDGQVFDIQWSTRAAKFEKTTGQRRPPAFQNLSGNPIALRPGQTWILIATPYSDVTEPNTRQWKVRIYSPEGFGEY